MPISFEGAHGDLGREVDERRSPTSPNLLRTFFYLGSRSVKRGRRTLERSAAADGAPNSIAPLTLACTAMLTALSAARTFPLEARRARRPCPLIGVSCARAIVVAGLVLHPVFFAVYSAVF